MHETCELDRCLCHTSQQPITDAIYDRPDVKRRQRGLPEQPPKPTREPRWLSFPALHQIPASVQQALGFSSGGSTKRKPSKRRPRKKAA